MKKLLFSLAACLFFGLTAFAQDGGKAAKTKAKRAEAAKPATAMHTPEGKKAIPQSSKRLKPKQMKVQPRSTAVPRAEKMEK